MSTEPEKAASFKTPDATPEILRVPGHCFFCETISLPEEIKHSEVSGFLELSLESIAPFPVKDLRWGYLHDREQQRALVYAAYHRRLAKYFDANSQQDVIYLVPDFASVFGLTFSAETHLVLVSPTSLTQLHFEPGHQLFSIKRCEPYHPENEPTSIADLPPEWATLGEKEGATFHYLAKTQARAGEDDGLIYTHAELQKKPSDEPARPAEGAPWSSLRQPPDTAWASDLRAPETKLQLRKTRKRERLLESLLAVAAVIALCFITSQVALFLFNRHVTNLSEEYNARQPSVVAIQDRFNLVTTLEQISRSNLRPFDMLEALNANRPQEVYFTEARAETDNRITIDGISGTVNSLNRYIDLIRDSRRFQLVGAPRTLTRQGRTQFTVTLDFLDNPPSEPAAADSQDTESARQ